MIKEKSAARIRYSRRPRKCPRCGVHAIAEIIYGDPASDPVMVLGEPVPPRPEPFYDGCIVDFDSPAWRCRNCGIDLYRRNPRLP